MKQSDEFSSRPRRETPGRERIAAAAKVSSSPLVQLCRIADVRPDVHAESDVYLDFAYEPPVMPKLRAAALERLRELRWDPDAPLDAEALVWLTHDKMQAWAAVLPPVNGGRTGSAHLLRNAMDLAGVRAGVDAEAVASLTENGTDYLRLVCVARGESAVRGEDSYAIPLVDETGDGQWQVDDWDRVNYAERSWLRLVEENQKLAEIIPPTPGRNGYDVTGSVLKGRDGRPCSRAAGPNTVLSEDGRYILASVDGHFTERDGRFRVHEILSIPGDVDYETGNIRFNGAVIIEGNVRPRFRVEADGDVIIHGTVENAFVSSGHNVTVWGGATAGHSGLIQAANDLRCKFMEHGRAYAGRNAQFETLILSSVSAGGSIDVTAGKGVVIGGSLTAMGDIRVQAAGNRAFRATTLTLAPTDVFLARKTRTSRQLDSARSEWQSIEYNTRSLIDHKRNPKIAQILARQAASLVEIQERIDDLRKDLEDMQEEEKAVRRHRIYTERAFPNVRVRIGGRSRILRGEFLGATFGLVDGDIQDVNEIKERRD